MLELSGVIFDVDGTITATNQLIFDSFNFVSEKYAGKTLSDQEIIALFGPPEDVVLKKLTDENFEMVQKDYYNFYRTNHKKMASLYPGIEDCFKLVKSLKLPLGIFTGKGKLSTKISLEELNISHYFEPIVTGDDVTNHKPSGDGILKFLEYHELSPKKVLMIGDSTQDVIAAREAGVNIAAVLWDSYGKADVEAMEPDFSFYSVNDLYLFLKKSLK